MNPVEIEEAVSQLASDPFDRNDFPFQFLAAFGNKKTTIDRLRKGNTNQSDLPSGVLQRGKIHIAVSDPGQGAETLTRLRESPKTATHKAKFILATDGNEFQAEDLISGETVAWDYADFPDHFLFAREAHFPTTIADLYPETMPEDLRRVRQEIDEVLERIYIGRRFRNDTERLEKLFELYTKMTGKKAAA